VQTNADAFHYPVADILFCFAAKENGIAEWNYCITARRKMQEGTKK